MAKGSGGGGSKGGALGSVGGRATAITPSAATVMATARALPQSMHIGYPGSGYVWISDLVDRTPGLTKESLGGMIRSGQIEAARRDLVKGVDAQKMKASELRFGSDEFSAWHYVVVRK